LSLVVISGCTHYSDQDVWVGQVPLGQEFQTYQAPPVRPSIILDTPEAPEPNGVMTLSEALAMALMHNPELRAFSWELRVSEARQLQERPLPNPELQVEVEEVGGTGERTDFDGAETTIQLSQLIELGDKRAKRIKVAELEKELARWDYEAKRLDVFTDVTKSFVDVLAAQERIELMEELVRLSERVLNAVGQRVAAGKDSPVEQIKARVTLASAQIQFEKAKRNLEAARRRLSATWGGRSPAFERAVGRFYLTSPVPSFAEVTSLINQNPDVARWAVEMGQRRAALELAKAKAIQDLKLSGGMQRFNETDDNALVFGLSIPLPVFDRNQGKIREATYRLVKAEEKRKAVETNVRSALSEAMRMLSSAFTEATLLKNDILPGAQSAFEVTSQGYREGKFDYLAVLDAQRTFFEAKARYVEALATYHRAKADVERLIGRGIDTLEKVQKENEVEGQSDE